MSTCRFLIAQTLAGQCEIVDALRNWHEITSVLIARPFSILSSPKLAEREEEKNTPNRVINRQKYELKINICSH